MAKNYKKRKGIEKRIRVKKPNAAEIYAKLCVSFSKRRDAVFSDGIRISTKNAVIVIKPPEFGVIEVMAKGDRERVVEELAKFEKKIIYSER